MQKEEHLQLPLRIPIMPLYFSQRRGAVARIRPSRAAGFVPFSIRFLGMDIGAHNPRATAIITSAKIHDQGNYQFLHTLNNTIYAYVFGDRIGDLTVSGICFASPCDGRESGFRQVLRNYEQNRIAKSGRPVFGSFAGLSFIAFLTEIGVEITDAEKNLGQWTMSFKTIGGGRAN